MLKKILTGAIIILLIIGIAILFSVPTWLLWNWLIPDIFGLRKITLLEAFGLILLSNILFRGKWIGFDFNNKG
jgi:hypothetical protein